MGAALDSISPGSPLFFSRSATSTTTSRLVRRGGARRLGPRLYTTDLDTPPDLQIRQNLWAVVAGYLPSAVITDRTGFELGVGDGSVTLVVERNANDRQLPGLRIRPRLGRGPLAGDQPFMRGLFLASEPRRFLDNLRLTRTRRGYRRTLTSVTIETELVKLLRRQGEAGLNGLRDGARELAPALGAHAELARLDGAISALLRTGPDTTLTAAGRAHATGLAFDPDRNLLFDALLAAVLSTDEVDLPDAAEDIASFAFWESYFSNYIEGTDFEVDEAERIVFDGYTPPRRPADARDVLGTFALAGGSARAEVAPTAEAFVELLRREHARMLSARPEIAPGDLKDRANRAGGTSFVSPPLVVGTLHQGFERMAAAPPGLPRAIVAMFVVSEVHPFVDGNGRSARLRMNAELTAAGRQRIIVPTAFQHDYLGALRRLSRSGDPAPLVRALARAQRFSSEVRFAEDRQATQAVLVRLGAFDGERVLRLPSEAGRPDGAV